VDDRATPEEAEARQRRDDRTHARISDTVEIGAATIATVVRKMEQADGEH
jgi:hypothetical protein